MIISNRSEPRPPQNPLDPAHIPFGKLFAPNFFVCEYANGAWQDPRIEPVHPFQLHPATLVFHYAQTIFEGMKAFRQADGSVALFRPDQNAKRLNRSAARMCMPQVPEDFFLSAVSELTRVEEAWVVDRPGSLYLRPVMMGTEASIGVRSSQEYIFFVLALPSGAYFPEARNGLGSVRVLISDSVLRASPGGTGSVKTGANYAVTLNVISAAKDSNCAQVLFLDSTLDHRVEEMGGMNIMFVENQTVVTPPLNETILPGVTRDTVLQLAREAGLTTREYAYPVKELLSKLRDGSIQEAFACGTAATITGIELLKTEAGEDFPLPAPGPISRLLYKNLTDLQFGHASDKHGWVRSVVEAKSLVS